MTTLKVDRLKPRRSRLPIILGVIGALLVGTLIMALIAAPLIFRALSPEWQDRIVRRLPFMGTYEPTRAFSSDVLPTVAGTQSNALALLATDTPAANVPVPTATATAQPPTDIPPVLPSPTLIPPATKLPPTLVSSPTLVAT